MSMKFTPPPPLFPPAPPCNAGTPWEKVTHDRQRGLLSFFRVYSGTLEAKQPLYNSTRGEEERPLQVLCTLASTCYEAISVLVVLKSKSSA